MQKIRYAIAAGAAIFAVSTAAESQIPRRAILRTTTAGVPAATVPTGMCQIWIDGMPAMRQSAPTDCATARARVPANGRIIYGSNTQGSVYGNNGQYDPRRDPRNQQYDPRLDRNSGRYDGVNNRKAAKTREHYERAQQRERDKYERKLQKDRDKEWKKSHKGNGHNDGDDRDDDRGGIWGGYPSRDHRDHRDHRDNNARSYPQSSGRVWRP